MTASSSPAVDFVAPAYLSVPERVGSYGDEAVDLVALAGRELDAEQVLAVDAMLSYGPGGRWVCLESVIVEARQNGKTGGVLLPVVLFDLFMLPPDRIVWTAHLFKTSRDAFSDVDMLIASSSELSRRVKQISYSHGEEFVELHSGARLEFLARSKGGGRGLGGKRVVMDEALFLATSSMGALLPTLSARPDPHVNYASSAGVAVSDHLRSLRDRGRAGDPTLIYAEWCAPPGGCADAGDCDHSLDREGCALDDESKWLLANHSLGRRITYDYVRQERRALARTPLEWARERLGWWDDPPAGGAGIIGQDDWKGQALGWGVIPHGTPEGFAVDMTPDRNWTSLDVYAGGVVDVVEHRAGSEWLLETCKALWKLWRVPFAIDPRGPAGNEIEALRDAGIDVLEPTTEQAVRATADFYDAIVDDKSLFHTDDPALNAAVEGAKKRSVGDGWLWDRKQGYVISPLVAATFARWAALQAGDVAVFSFSQLEMCDACGISPHEDPDGAHGYLCASCREAE